MATVYVPGLRRRVKAVPINMWRGTLGKAGRPGCFCHNPFQELINCGLLNDLPGMSCKLYRTRLHSQKLKLYVVLYAQRSHLYIVGHKRRMLSTP